MDTMRQIRDREHRLREAVRRGLCTGTDSVSVCLARLAAHDRLAALAPELLAFVRETEAWLAWQLERYPEHQDPQAWRQLAAARQLVTRTESDTR